MVCDRRCHYRPDYGTESHRLAHLHDRGWLEITERQALGPEYRDPLEGYIRWVDDNPQYSFTHIETPMIDSGFRFAGTPDRIAVVHDGSYYIVIDLKFGIAEPAARIQAVAYASLVRGNRKALFPDAELLTPVKAMILYIDKWGNTKSVLIPWEEHNRNWQTFQCALHVYRWREKHRKL